MLERINKLLLDCNNKRLAQQCENEDLAKEILFLSTNKTEDEQNERRKFLNKRLQQRENLYIYPEQVNV